MILPSGFPGMEDEEVGYGTASTFGVPTIFHPNPNLFHAPHFPAAVLVLHEKQERTYRDYALLQVAVPPHEIVHCGQTLLWKNKVSEWRKELEASSACFGILHYISEKFPAFANGFGYEAMLVIYDSTVWLHKNRIKDDESAQYTKFRDCMGKGGVQPLPGAGEDYLSTHPVQTWYVKCRLTVEGYAFMKTKWQGFVVSCLKTEKGEAAEEGNYIPVEWENLEDMMKGTYSVDPAKDLPGLST
eukprot:TRINITY_DN18032_c0_g1_i1.p1 TRINITY_DN18032_c0_g1~~TRINITY_DN18032_c0_g1_i1.p1  ORF type:complete len:243 (+),score=38.27 TRINITY_DN18032_c0_g1_i1:526-1254(+)